MNFSLKTIPKLGAIAARLSARPLSTAAQVSLQFHSRHLVLMIFLDALYNKHIQFGFCFFFFLQNNGFIKIVEVGPRDGLQNESKIVSFETKLELINLLTNCGLPVIEAASFVSPKWVPQMADSSNIIKSLNQSHPTKYTSLVPNQRGLEMAHKAGAKEIAIFGAASETFSRKNINCSIDESFEKFEMVVKQAKDFGMSVRGYVSCVVACPYEGKISSDVVADISARMFDLGCYEISLGDTIGVATPEESRNLIRKVSTHIPVENLAVHFHDTYGQAIANIYASIQEGIRTVDSSVAGLGGCPYAVGASGNVATEDVVYLAHGLGFLTGVNLEKLVRTGSWISEELGRPYGSKAGQAVLAKITSNDY
ncbi:Hydroxymethylglutaryl-CoA lyase, mitochondrial [Smittium mucronatum]|uniref:hydroxymethylglutaryl-CoA lyase n=1 Tax=Smittium mucronatum TaxID=133383 RepID=A0A1R0GUZ8_9FUNG|nr:Hydroxymethylglutaryl-CoA lyase, mitochondrial [Smittium mucronatum]